MDSAEIRVCNNIYKIGNRASIWDPAKARAASNRELYQKHRDYMDRYLANNDAILKQIDNLLVEVLNYIDAKDSSSDLGETYLDATIETLRAITGEEA